MTTDRTFLRRLLKARVLHTASQTINLTKLLPFPSLVPFLPISSFFASVFFPSFPLAVKWLGGIGSDVNYLSTLHTKMPF